MCKKSKIFWGEGYLFPLRVGEEKWPSPGLSAIKQSADDRLLRNMQTLFWMLSEKLWILCWRELCKEGQLVHAVSFKYMIPYRFQELSKEAREIKSAGEDAENVEKGRCRKGTVPNQWELKPKNKCVCKWRAESATMLVE